MKFSHYWVAGALITSISLTNFSNSAELPDFTQLIEKNKSSVVSITVTGTAKNAAGSFEGIPEELRPFFQMPQVPRSVSGSGSGFIIEKEGLIITNAHVVKDADDIRVYLNDRREFKAELIGSDQKSDIALLKIEADQLPAVSIGDVNTLKVGQWVVAIGSPFGLDYTATQGIISSLARNLPNDSYTPFIQTDAAVNPGNSGGPLFNLAGEVIGINSQIYSRTGNYAGISFAIPIDLAMDVVGQLKSEGKVTRGWLGVMIQEVTVDLAESFNLDKPKGALIGEVMADSPAFKASLQPGDIIVKFNGIEVKSSRELPSIVARIKPDTEVTLEIYRDGKTQEMTVKIEALPDQPQSSATRDANKLGISVAAVEQGKGVRVVEVDPAIARELIVDDILLKINNTDINTMNDFLSAVKPLKAGQTVRLLVKRDQTNLFMAIKVPKE